MSRFLTNAAEAQAQAAFHTLIILAKFEFDEPVYAHTGIGTVTYDGDTYLGVGDFGSIGPSRESENLGPMQMDISLAAPNSTHLAEALDAGNYGDPMTLFAAYRSSAGTLVANPWVVWSGWFEFASIRVGTDNQITISGQHDLAVLNEIKGSRFTDEDQQSKYPGDNGFLHIHRMATTRLLWGGKAGFWGRDIDDLVPDRPGEFEAR